ncbi:restriction endonuclease [Rheinheimera hassiensis]|uniref:restriction endonuclease n=1 Tax=Rheinheimera hassiensis TaxID=1193627 RepID=UPI001F070CFF|nr:restriction endonuclease [Rheinheimera hassiensis]
MELCETSKDYELLTQKIYKAILESEGVENIAVRHDVKIKGKSGVEHQIDVFWEYRYVGVSHKVLIECKYYTKPVSLIHARNMLGLLSDIPSSQGLIVTTQGFQSGVIDFCCHYEINLKKIRPPQGSDWDGCIQIVNVNGELYQNQYLDMKLAFDGKDTDTKAYFDMHGSQISFNVYDSSIKDGGVVSFIGEWLDSKIVANLGQLNTPNTEVIEPENAYIVLPTTEKLKIKSVTVLWQLNKQELSISVDAMDFVHAVLEDFNSGEIEYTLNKEHYK